MVRSPASARRCTRPFRLPKRSPRPTASSGVASGPTAAGAASSRRRPRPEALTTPSTTSVLCTRRGRRAHALLERGLQISRPVVFAQQVAEGLVGELLQRLHGVAPEQVQGLPGLLVEFHELAPGTGRLLGHDDLLRWNDRRAGSFIARGCDGPTKTRSAYTLSGRESAWR